jgi:heterodisulfide reductase subunit B
VASFLGSELTELKDWNCCGSTPSTAVDELGSYCMAARNLALAEKARLELVTPCSACYVILSRTDAYLKQYPELKLKVDAALAAGGLEYHGTVKVRHVLDVLTNDIGFGAIAERVVKSLRGLKVAPYYGCQAVRPGFGLDHPENPHCLDKLVTSLGAEPVSFAFKTHCCGGSLIITEEDLALRLILNLLEDAVRNGAQCIVTVCPLCQLNLDAYQSEVNKKYRTRFNLPILHFTQLMGVALGLGGVDLGLKLGVVSSQKVLAEYM